MAICADQRDYKAAFEKHFYAFINWGNTGSDSSKRLVLVYCVECGLKYLLMRTQGINRINNARNDIQKILYSHNLLNMLKILRQAGNFSFQQIETIHGDMVLLDNYHEFCRYCIRPVQKHQGRVQDYERQLIEIAKWLRERVLAK